MKTLELLFRPLSKCSRLELLRCPLLSNPAPARPLEPFRAAYLCLYFGCICCYCYFCSTLDHSSSRSSILHHIPPSSTPPSASLSNLPYYICYQSRVAYPSPIHVITRDRPLFPSACRRITNPTESRVQNREPADLITPAPFAPN